MAEENNILVFGASIVYGAADLDKGGWAQRLNIFVSGKTEWDVHTYNLGISGDISSDLLKRFSSECSERRKPGIILISIGINDSQYIDEPGNMRAPPETFRENLRKIVERAKSKSQKVAFIGFSPVDEKKTMPIPWKTDTYYTEENVRRYDRIAREVCEGEQVPYIDMMKVFPEATEELFHDGLHPNAKGHKLMFEAVKQFLEEKGWV
jgi:lysophospholipase L1-like esterase